MLAVRRALGKLRYRVRQHGCRQDSHCRYYRSSNDDRAAIGRYAAIHDHLRAAGLSQTACDDQCTRLKNAVRQFMF